MVGHPECSKVSGINIKILTFYLNGLIFGFSFLRMTLILVSDTHQFRKYSYPSSFNPVLLYLFLKTVVLV